MKPNQSINSHTVFPIAEHPFVYQQQSQLMVGLAALKTAAQHLMVTHTRLVQSLSRRRNQLSDALFRFDRIRYTPTVIPTMKANVSMFDTIIAIEFTMIP
jgi:hypothetical protein